MGYDASTVLPIDGDCVKTTADSSTIGGLYVVHTVALAAGAIGDTDIVLKHKTRILNVQTILKGAGVAGCVLTVKNAANAITDAIDISTGDKTKNWALTIDDAYWDIAAGGTLRLTTSVGATQPACYVIIQGMRV